MATIWKLDGGDLLVVGTAENRTVCQTPFAHGDDPRKWAAKLRDLAERIERTAAEVDGIKS